MQEEACPVADTFSRAKAAKKQRYIMSERKDLINPGLEAVGKAITFGGSLYSSAIVHDFNAAFDHVLAMLEDAVHLFKRGSFNTSALLAITAIEETGKAHVGIFRRDHLAGSANGRDPLRDHKQKHRMAVLPTVFMGVRLKSTLGEDVCLRLQQEAETSGFIASREASLYCAMVNGCFVSPRAAFAPERAWELLLLAIETLFDSLVGYTNHTNAKSVLLDEMFEQVTASKPGG